MRRTPYERDMTAPVCRTHGFTSHVSVAATRMALVFNAPKAGLSSIVTGQDRSSTCEAIRVTQMDTWWHENGTEVWREYVKELMPAPLIPIIGHSAKKGVRQAMWAQVSSI